MSEWHKYDIQDIALEFGTDTTCGRSHINQDRKRRSNNNIFKLPTADAGTVLKHLSSDATFMLLAFTYILTAIFGHLNESLAGIISIIAIFFFAFCIKYSSLKRISNSYRMLLPISRVIENGDHIRLSVFDVEAGDLVCFSQGDIIPADARLVSSTGLIVAERYINAATGKNEYRRVEKNHSVVYKFDDSKETYENMVYAGSMVVSGKGSAIVTEIGSDTRLSKSHSGISLVPNNDTPIYLQSFYKSAKRTSLTALMLVVPVSLTVLVARSMNKTGASEIDVLYIFMLLLSLAVTCMSEFTASPAETLVTKELLPSSRSKKVRSNTESRITKLSSAEALADIDSILILAPEVLIDTDNSVRRIFFADKQYRFDALKSEDLNFFFDLVLPIFKFTNYKNMTADLKAVSAFLSERISDVKHEADVIRPRFLKNFPLNGARSCVFKTDDQGTPMLYVAHSSNLSLIEKCEYFRTEGGGKWKLDQKVIADISESYDIYNSSGLKTQVFVSADQSDGKLIFEGMIATGKEYPFADGELIEELAESGIHPILVLDDENEDNINLALQCGIINAKTDLALASEYKRNGMTLSDSPISTKAYVGFGAAAVSEIFERMKRNGRRVLPVIKDSVDRRSISPCPVYATNDDNSYDSVRIASSMSLKTADSVAHEGGLFDALKMIRGSSIARLKLGIYKNYLVYSMFVRIVAVCIPLLFEKSSMLMTTLMILLSGFICDGIALSSLMFSKGIPVKPKNAAADAKTLFSSSIYVFFAIAGSLSSAVILIMSSILHSLGVLSESVASFFVMYSVFAVQIVALGGLLVILNKRSRRRKVNWCYLIFIAFYSALLMIQSKLPDAFFAVANGFGIQKINFDLLPYVAIAAAFALGVVLLISRLLSVFSKS